MFSAVLSLLALSASARGLAVQKAASPYVNLGCQCSSLTFRDAAGAVQVRSLFLNLGDLRRAEKGFSTKIVFSYNAI